MTGTSLKPHSNVPKLIPRAPTPRKARLIGATPVTVLVVCMWYNSVYIPTDARALFAPYAIEMSVHVMICMATS